MVGSKTIFVNQVFAAVPAVWPVGVLRRKPFRYQEDAPDGGLMNFLEGGQKPSGTREQSHVRDMRCVKCWAGLFLCDSGCAVVESAGLKAQSRYMPDGYKTVCLAPYLLKNRKLSRIVHWDVVDNAAFKISRSPKLNL